MCRSKEALNRRIKTDGGQAMSVIKIPPRSGARLRLSQHKILRIEDITGGQICDLVAYRAGDPTEWISNGRTFDYCGSIRIQVGDWLYSNRSRKMLKIVKDDVQQHDFLYAACSKEMFEIQYGLVNEWPNCASNIAACLADLGVQEHDIPTPFNIFQNVRLKSDGTLNIQPPKSKSGDSIWFEASMDLDIALSACSAPTCNGGACSGIAYEISESQRSLS